MSFYTRLGSSLWSWDPWLSLERDGDDIVGCRARILWLALYTSPEAKRVLPGLWHGSISTMADAAHMSTDHVWQALQRLIEHQLVEYDQKCRVVRLIVLPDAGESPQNGKVIHAWFKRFKSVTPCAVRDAHVATIRWMMEEWTRESGRPISNDHNKAWSDTFGQVACPAPGRNGVTTLFDHDTGTAVQPSLFASVKHSESVVTVSGTVSNPAAVDDPAQIPKSNKITVPVTVCDTVGSGEGSGDGSLLSGSGEGGSGGGSASGKPSLRALPSIGFDAMELVGMLSDVVGGTFTRLVTSGALRAIASAIDAAATDTRTPGALVLLREYIASGCAGRLVPVAANAEERSRGGITPELVASPGWIALAIQQATSWKSELEGKRAAFAAARNEAGV